MRVVMKTPGKHDGRAFSPGTALDLDEREAAALLARGLCVAAGDPPGKETGPQAAEREPEDAPSRRGRPKKDGG